MYQWVIKRNTDLEENHLVYYIDLNLDNRTYGFLLDPNFAFKFDTLGEAESFIVENFERITCANLIVVSLEEAISKWNEHVSQGLVVVSGERLADNSLSKIYNGEDEEEILKYRIEAKRKRFNVAKKYWETWPGLKYKFLYSIEILKKVISEYQFLYFQFYGHFEESELKNKEKLNNLMTNFEKEVSLSEKYCDLVYSAYKLIELSSNYTSDFRNYTLVIDLNSSIKYKMYSMDVYYLSECMEYSEENGILDKEEFEKNMYHELKCETNDLKEIFRNWADLKGN